MSLRKFGQPIKRGPGRSKTVEVPGVGMVDVEMRFQDRRDGTGFTHLQPRPGVKSGFVIMRGYGKRRTVVALWLDDQGRQHAWMAGPEPGQRGRASSNYGVPPPLRRRVP